MNKSFRLHSLALGLILFASTLGASAQGKIGFIDLRKIFDGYYKTKQADANLKDEAGDMDKQRKEMIEDFNKHQEDWKKVMDKANDQAVSTEEREKSKQAAEKKLLDLKEMEQSITQYERAARTKLEEKKLRMRDKIVQEIRDVINVKAKADNYFAILDSSAQSAAATPVLLYSNGENDLTDVILKQINATAPLVTAPPADEKKKDPAPKPAK